MFKKPFKIKSNTQLKSTERKNFKDVLLKTFPNFTGPQVDELLPKKEALFALKIVTHSNAVVNVYTIQKRPLIFEVETILFPTIFLLWKFPDLIYAFTTHQQVMNYISSGAGLMLPGVVTPPSHSGLSKYGNVSEQDVVCVNMTDNKAAIAVGLASQSSAAMSLEGLKGKCVDIYHFHGDNLCTLEGLPSCPVPKLGPPVWLQRQSFDEDFPALGSSRRQMPQGVDNSLPVETEDVQTNNIEDESEIGAQCLESTEDPIDMDELLHHCFLGALKYTNNLKLPVLTSNFYKLHMLPLSPVTNPLEIKKTTFKKLKPFLKEMSEDELITVKEIKGGVEAITAINKDHPKIREFYMSPSDRPKKETDKENPPATDVVESYVITENVLPLFEGCRKGEIVQAAEVRKHVTRYVKENNLQDESNKSLVKPRDALANVCKTEHPVPWEEAIEKVCEAMKNCYKVTTGNEEKLSKGKIVPISMTVSTRSGNKKVTLVDNLELFGVRVSDFAKECQHGVAASTSISRPPGKKSDQVLVQGNQVLFIYNLLTEKYKVPKKYITGLELAPRKK